MMLELRMSSMKRKPQINPGLRSERGSSYYIKSEHHFKWDMAFDHWSTHMNIRDPRKAFRSITQNSFSSGLILNGEGRHHFSVGKKNVALRYSFNFRIFFASYHAVSRAQCSYHSVSSWDRSSNLGALGQRWWESLWKILLSDWFFVSKCGIAQYCGGEAETSDWFRRGWPLP